MKKTLVSAALFAAMTGSVGASTLDSVLDKWKTSNYYLGLLISNSDLEEDQGVGQDMSVFHATLGYTLPKGFAVEARFGAGSDQLDTVFQEPVTRYAAAMLRYHYTWRNNIMTYAGIGASYRTHSSAVNVSDQQSGGAFAFGVNLFGNDQTAINIEYTYMGGSEAMKSIGIGFHRYFGKY